MIAALVAALAGVSPAPAFSCAARLTRNERLICGSATLRSADARLGRAYRRSLARLGPQGQAQLRLSQRAWIRFRDSVCLPRPAGASEYFRTPATCLEIRYSERLSEMEKSVRKVGPFQVVRLDGYRVWPAPGHVGLYDGVVTDAERFDWIDVQRSPAPLRAAARLWNGAMAKRPALAGRRFAAYRAGRPETDPEVENGGPETDTGQEREIVAASSRAIVGGLIEYYTGAFHPWESMWRETLLVEERRPMRVADLIGRAGPFSRFADRRLAARLTASGPMPFAPKLDLDPGSLEIGLRGVVVHYGQAFGRPSGEIDVTLPWKDVRPFLSRKGLRLAASFGG